MRTLIVAAKLRCPSLTNLICPRYSLTTAIADFKGWDSWRHTDGVFLNERCNRLRILQDVIDRRLTKRLAVCRLEISDSHCRRLLERYREHGLLSLVVASQLTGN